MPTGLLNVGGLPLFIPPTSFYTFDRYHTRNQYYGAQIGGDFEWYEGRVFVNGSAKLAVGDMHQVVEVNGYTVNPSGQVFPGGLLTQATDRGEHSRDRLAFVPEVTLNLGYQVTPHLRIYVGYDGLDIHRVAQPGDQIGFFTSTTQVTFAGTTTTAGVTQAAFHFKDTEVWRKGQTLASSSAIDAASACCFPPRS